MGYNQLNKLKYYKKVQDLTLTHHEQGITYLKGVFQKYIEPIYPMSFSQYRRILGEPCLTRRIAALEEQEEIEKTNSIIRKKSSQYEEYHSTDPKQLQLF